MPNNFCSINTPSSLFRIPWIAKQRKNRCSNNFLLCVLERKSFSPQALPMHSHFAYCSSTSHIPVPILPGWGLQVPVMHSQFLKTGDLCRGLWNWHRDHPVQYQPGGIREPDSDSAFSHMPWVIDPTCPKPEGLSNSFPAKPQYEMDVFRVIPPKSHLSFLTLYITWQYLEQKGYLSLQQGVSVLH